MGISFHIHRKTVLINITINTQWLFGGCFQNNYSGNTFLHIGTSVTLPYPPQSQVEPCPTRVGMVGLAEGMLRGREPCLLNAPSLLLQGLEEFTAGSKLRL